MVKDKKEMKKITKITVKNYPIGDFLIRLKNCVRAGKKEVVVDNTKLIESVAKTLKSMGYLSNVEKEGGILKVNLVYKSKMPILSDIILVSKPSNRVYISSEEIKKVRSPYMMILTTTSGIMSGGDAVKKNLGGEVIAKIL